MSDVCGKRRKLPDQRGLTRGDREAANGDWAREVALVSHGGSLQLHSATFNLVCASV